MADYPQGIYGRGPELDGGWLVEDDLPRMIVTEYLLPTFVDPRFWTNGPTKIDENGKNIPTIPESEVGSG